MPRILLLLIATTFLLSACTPTKTPAEQFELATTSFNNHDYKHAVIHLKNLLAHTSDDSYTSYNEAKYLLAKSYEALNKPNNAERFWLDILKLDLHVDEALAALAYQYYKDTNFVAITRLIDQYIGYSSKSDNVLKLYQALIAHKSGSTVEANNIINTLPSEAKSTTLGRYTHAFLLSIEAPSKAISLLNKLIEDEPKYEMGWLLRAHLLSSTGDISGAYDNFKHYLLLEPDDVYIHFLLAMAAQRMEDYSAMQKHVDILLSQNPKQSLANHLQATLTYRNRDFERTRYHAELSIQNGLTNSMNSMMAGVSSANLGQFENAYHHLSQLKSEYHEHQGYIRVFTWVQLNLGLLNEALDQFSSLAIDTDSEYHLGNMLATTLVDNEQVEAASTLLNQLQMAPVNDPMLKLKHGVLQLETGNIGGLKLIADIAGSEQTNDTIKMVQILALADADKKDDAMKEAIDWHLDNKENVLPINLIALLHQKNKNLKLAARWLRHSVAIEPNNIPALLHLGFYELKQNKLDLANRFFENVLTLVPNHPKAFTGLIEVMAAEDTQIDWSQVIAKMDLDKDYLQSLFVISFNMYQSQEYQSLNNYLMKFDESSRVQWPLSIWKIWINSLIALEHSSLREKVYSLSKTLPNGPSYLFVISVLERQQDYGFILEYIDWLESKSKVTNEIQYAKANALLYLSELDLAEFLITQLEAKPHLPPLSWLKGKLLIEKGKINSGIQLVAEFFNLHPTRNAMVELATAAKSNNQLSHVVAIGNHYLSQSPDDHHARTMIANWLLKAHPNQALKILDVPNSTDFILQHWQISNNLGWLHLAVGDKQRALKFTENAYNKNIKNQQVTLNYAQALVANGDSKKAAAILNNIPNKNSDIVRFIKQL